METASRSSDTDMEDDGGISLVTKLFARQNLHDVPAALLQQITPEDRMESLHDVHGVFQPVEENPEFLDEKMHELREALCGPCLSGSDSREAYDEVVENHPDFVEDQLIKFLRADNFDVKKAATRVMKHFQAKKQFFGAENLGEELQLKHLNDLDRQALKEGAVQLLNKRDRSGRAIVAQFPRTCYNYPAEVSAKLLFWSAVLAARDKEIQRRGLVIVFYGVKAPKIERDGTKKGPEYTATFPCMPVRVVSVHCCFDDVTMRDTLNTLAHFIESRYLIRFQSHFGNSTECQYNLMTFGIPLATIPVRDDGSLDLEVHQSWLRQLQVEESGGSSCTKDSSDSPTKTEPPGPWDVIMGRGLRGRKSPGNQLLKRLLEERRGAYDCASRVDKAAIIKDIYVVMRRKGCRFLAPASVEKSNLDWVEVGEEAARDRIGHGFRNLRLAAKR